MKKFVLVLIALIFVTASLSAQGIQEAINASYAPAPAAVVAEPAKVEAPALKDVIFAKAEVAEKVVDLKANELYKQVAVSSVTPDYCGRNAAKLVSDEAVVFGVKGNLYMVGILPAGSAVPEGMVELKIEL